MQQNKQNLGASFQSKNILIIGDVMIDRYVHGSVDRISPEAPVPVVNIKRTENRLGGAANVALNVKSLGANPLLCAVIGDDENGDLLQSLLPNFHIPPTYLKRSKERQTTIKTRILSNNQQLLRCDREDKHLLSEQEEQNLLSDIEMHLESKPIDAVLFQDYNKGVLTPNLIHTIIRLAKNQGIPTAVDPKFKHFFTYKGVDLFKPNLKEVNDILPFKVIAKRASLDKASAYIRAKLQHRYTMITLSEKGIYLDDGNQSYILPTHPRIISDVCGAGDSVISVATTALAANMDIKKITTLANLAGGQVCEKVGVVPVHLEQLESEYALL